MTPLLPWQQAHWSRLEQYKRQNRLPQALLISGMKGVGKRQLADQFAFSLLCTQPNGDGFACGHCHGCRLIASSSHPDLLRIEPPESGKDITIQQIRDLIDKVQLKPQYERYRIVIIDPADRMNTASVNAFLKCLEEPTERTVILLITEKPAGLPATVISRCQKLVCGPPGKSVLRQWLMQAHCGEELNVLTSMAQYSPLLAKSAGETQLLAMRKDCLNDWIAVAKQKANPVPVAESWLKLPHSLLLFWICTWLVDLVKCNYRADRSALYNADHFSHLQEFSGQLDLKSVYRLYDLILAGRQRLDTQVNKQLMLEEILIVWSELNRS